MVLDDLIQKSEGESGAHHYCPALRVGMLLNEQDFPHTWVCDRFPCGLLGV